MLNKLRVRLTLLYLLGSILLVGLVGICTYGALTYFFENSNDAALRFKMALLFRTTGEIPPAELQTAEAEWMSQNQEHFLQYTSHDEEEEWEDEHGLEEYEDYLEEAYEGELSSIFVMPLDAEGTILFNPNPYPLQMEADKNAIENAKLNGFDLRTGKMSDGTQVRLLTYPFPPGNAYEFIQLGKSTADQFRVLNQFLGGLVGIGTFFIVLLGGISWWLAGNTLKTSQKAWDNQQQFIANASHELRTPLTLIRASADVALRHSSAGSEQANLMKDILLECDHMTGLVEDMLLLTRLDTQKLEIELSNISLKDLLNEIRHQFEPIMQERQLDWQVAEFSGLIYANESRLRQVILILLDNAMRHTPVDERISIEAQKSANKIELVVSDSGSGIPAEALPHIFDRFYQVENARAEHGSSGLGLSIAKSLIEAQQGEIRIESEFGKGTSVHILLQSGR
jgi:signal transduction histidine kinase